LLINKSSVDNDRQVNSVEYNSIGSEGVTSLPTKPSYSAEYFIPLKVELLKSITSPWVEISPVELFTGIM